MRIAPGDFVSASAHAFGLRVSTKVNTSPRSIRFFTSSTVTLVASIVPPSPEHISALCFTCSEAITGPFGQNRKTAVDSAAVVWKSPGTGSHDELGVYALGTLGRVHHRRDKVFERGGGVAATAGVDRRGLNNCAARSNEPVKTFTLR